jgi:dienelactone hydrolase
MGTVGLETYQSILEHNLNAHSKDSQAPQAITLIGFSVGAATIWRFAHTPPRSKQIHIKKAFCFYGSQIRNHIAQNTPDTHPICDIDLIFPKHESHFNVDELITRIKDKELSRTGTNQITCTKTNGLHGFMNEVSSNFDQTLYKQFIKNMQKTLI